MSAEIPVSILFQARDETGGAISSLRAEMGDIKQTTAAATGATEDYGAALRAQAPLLSQQRQLNRLNTFAFREQHEVMFTSIQLAGDVGRGAMKLVNIWTAHNTMQLRVADAEERVNEAKEETLEALRRYGPQSAKYEKALKNEVKATQTLEQTQQEGQIQMISYGVAAASMASDILTGVKRVQQLNFAASQRGGWGATIKGVFGKGGASAIPAGGAVPSLGATAGTVGGASLLARGGPPALVAAAGTIALEQIQNQLPEQFHPVLQALSPVLLLEKLLGGGQLSGVLGINELIGKGGGEAAGGPVVVQGDLNVYGAQNIQQIQDEAMRQTIRRSNRSRD